MNWGLLYSFRASVHYHRGRERHGRKAGRLGARAQLRAHICSKLQEEGERLGLVWALRPYSPPHRDTYSSNNKALTQSFQNQTHQLGTKIPTHEPMGPFSVKPHSRFKDFLRLPYLSISIDGFERLGVSCTGACIAPVEES